MWCGSCSKTDISWGENSSFFPANDPTFLAPYPHLLFWPPPSPPALLISEHYFFSLHSKLPSDVFPYNCWTGRIYLSVIKTRPYHCPHSWKLLSVLLARQEVLCLHISTSVASIQPLSPVDYLWVGPSGSSVPLRLPQTNHRLPFHWMLLTTKGWVLNYLWLFLASSVWNNIEQGNQGYI